MVCANVYFWLDISGHVCVDNTTTSFKLNSDPSTFLWNQLVSGEAVVLGLEACRAPVVKIKDQVLNAAFRSTFDKKTDSSACLLLGTVQSTSEGDGIAIVVDQFYSETLPPSASGALHVPYKFEKVQASPGTPEKQEYLARISKLYEDWTSLDLQSGANLSSAVSLEICARTRGPSCSLSVEAVTFSLPLKVVPLFPMPVIRNATYENLRATSNSSQDFGFVTLCGHRLCLYPKQQYKDSDLNIIGVWISGVRSIQHPFVWFVGSQFISNSSVTSHPLDIFVLTLLCPSSDSTPSQTLFYNCVSPKASTPEFDLWKGQGTASVSRVPTATNKVIALQLEKVTQGRASENFEWARKELRARAMGTNGNDRCGTSWKDVVPPAHGTWPMPPVPTASEPLNTSPTVPDVSFYGSPPFCERKSSPSTVFTADANFSHRTTVPLTSPTEGNPAVYYGQFRYPVPNHLLPQHPHFPNNNGLYAQTAACTSAQTAPQFSANVGAVSSAIGQSPPTFPASAEAVWSVQNLPAFPVPTNFSAHVLNGPQVNRSPEAYNMERRFEADRSNSSPEVYELIRRQDLQLSELKAQIQQLLDNRRCQPQGSTSDPYQDARQDGRPGKQTTDASTMTSSHSSSAKGGQRPLSLDVATQTDRARDGSQCPLCGHRSPSPGPASKQKQQEAEHDDEEYTLFFPEKAQCGTRAEKSGGQRAGNAFFTEDKAFGSSGPVSGNSCRTPFRQSPHRRLESTQHTVSFRNEASVQGKSGTPCESTTAKSTLETFLHPRLDYQTLLLNEPRDARGSGDLSFQANRIARKYCPTNFGTQSPLAERKSKGPHGNPLLRQVLAQEAQKKAGVRAEDTAEDGSGVSFATREYLKNYGLLDDAQRREGYEEDAVENILNISELKRLPKLL